MTVLLGLEHESQELKFWQIYWKNNKKEFTKYLSAVTQFILDNQAFVITTY